MSDNVQFDTDQEGMTRNGQFVSRTVFGQAETPGMAAWLIKKGIIKNESQAKGILLGVVCMNIILTLLVIYFFILK